MFWKTCDLNVDYLVKQVGKSKREQRSEYLRCCGGQHNEVAVCLGLGKIYHITHYKAHLCDVRLRNANSFGTGSLH
jgi:hypothetical protein